MDAAALQQLLASGDVDALRRMLKHGAAEAEEAVAAPAAAASSPSSSSIALCAAASSQDSALFAGRKSVKFVVGNAFPVQLCDYRSMGKLVWPAGHAVAEVFARIPSEAVSSSLAVVEVGAGAGVPSLVAAAVGARVAIATDFTEECVELLRHNDALNGRKLTECVRLDVGEHSSLEELLRQHRVTDAVWPHVLVVACDCSYDPKTVTNLFASAGQLLVRPMAPSPLVCFARADMFAHLDEHTVAAARMYGFDLAARTHHRAAGVLDAVSETYLTPCAEDAVDCLYFVRAADAEGARAHNPVLQLLLRASAETDDPSVEVVATSSALEDVWAPQ